MLTNFIRGLLCPTLVFFSFYLFSQTQTTAIGHHQEGSYRSFKGNYNVHLGAYSGYNVPTTTSKNVFIGWKSGYNSSSYYSVFVGPEAGINSSGSGNVFLGNVAGGNSSGSDNIAIGAGTGGDLTTGWYNVFIGGAAGNGSTGITGNENVAMGRKAGYKITSGYNNTFLGSHAGFSTTSGYGNIFIGRYSGLNETGSNKLYIDNSSTSNPLIWGDFSSNYVNIGGRLGIGDKTPSYPLDVSGDMRSTGTIRTNSHKTSLEWEEAYDKRINSVGSGLSLSANAISLTTTNSPIASVSSHFTVNGNIKSNRFEDLDDASFFVNPASTSELNAVDGNFYDLNPNVAGEVSRGIRFWNSDSYKIHMGNAAENKYGPVQDFSIKHNMNNDSDRGWRWGVTGVTPVAAISTLGDMQIKRNFTAEGSLGIGSTPSYPLHVKKSTDTNNRIAYFESSNSSGADASIAIKGARSNYDGIVSFIDLDIYDNDESTPTFTMGRIAAGKKSGSGINGTLRFYTNNNGLSERMRIDADGDVGIGTGTSDPNGKLHIFKNATTGSISNPTLANAGLHVQDNGANLYVDGNTIYGDQNMIIGTVAEKTLQLGTNSATRMTIGTNGKVGIGDTSPNTDFNVNGIVRGSYDASEAEYVEISHGGSHGYINTVGDGRLDFRHDGNTLMQLEDDGNFTVFGTIASTNSPDWDRAFEERGSVIAGSGLTWDDTEKLLNLDGTFGSTNITTTGTITSGSLTTGILNGGDGLNLRGASPSIHFNDTDNTDEGSILVNSGWFYILGHHSTNNDNHNGGWEKNGTYWPFRVNLANDNLELGGDTYLKEGNLNVEAGDVIVSGTITTDSNGSSSEWNEAYQWGDHADQGYYKDGAEINISKITGLEYDNGNGGIFGSNFNISGVNVLTINDPGEGINFHGSNQIYVIDDASDDKLYVGPGNIGIGILPAEKLHINGSIRGNQSGALRVSTGHGYVDIGPKNTGWSHFNTDRSKFYFNKGISVNQGLVGSHDEDLQLQASGVTGLTISTANQNVTIPKNLEVQGNLKLNKSNITEDNTQDDLMVMRGDGTLASRSLSSIESPWLFTQILVGQDEMLAICPDSEVIGQVYVDVIDLNGNIRFGDNAYIDDDLDYGDDGDNDDIPDDWMKFSDRIEFKSSHDDYGIVLFDQTNYSDFLNLHQENGSSYLSSGNTASNYFMKATGRNVTFGGEVTIPSLQTNAYNSSSSINIISDTDNNQTGETIVFGTNGRLGSANFQEVMRLEEGGGIFLSNIQASSATNSLLVRDGNGKIFTRQANTVGPWDIKEGGNMNYSGGKIGLQITGTASQTLDIGSGTIRVRSLGTSTTATKLVVADNNGNFLTRNLNTLNLSPGQSELLTLNMVEA